MKVLPAVPPSVRGTIHRWKCPVPSMQEKTWIRDAPVATFRGLVNRWIMGPIAAASPGVKSA